MSIDTVDQQRDIGKLWGAIERVNGDVKALSVALVGMDGGNGLRGELREFIHRFEADHAVRLTAVEDRVEEGIEYGRRLYDVERHKPGECIGKTALDEYVAELNAKANKESDMAIEMKKSRDAMLTALVAALITSAASIIVAFISIKGVTP